MNKRKQNEWRNDFPKEFYRRKKKRNMTLTVEPVREFIYSRMKRRNNQINCELSKKKVLSQWEYRYIHIRNSLSKFLSIRRIYSSHHIRNDCLIK
jgi:hypothetical protein